MISNLPKLGRDFDLQQTMVKGTALAMVDPASGQSFCLQEAGQSELQTDREVCEQQTIEGTAREPDGLGESTLRHQEASTASVPPKLRTDLTVSKQGTGDESVFVVKEPVKPNGSSPDNAMGRQRRRSFGSGRRRNSALHCHWRV